VKSTSLRRAAIAAVVLAPVLAACGFNAQTDQPYQPAEGVLNRDKDVDVLNALIVSGENGSGTFVANLVNNNVEQADKLVSVTGPEITVPANALGGPAAGTTIPAGGALNLAADGRISVTGEGVVAGKFVEVTLAFASGDQVTVRVPVVRNDGDYADVPLPSAEPTATPTDGTTADPSVPSQDPSQGPGQEPTGDTAE
jgi:hypothetical protein